MKFWRTAAFSALALSAVITVDSLRRIWKLRRQIDEIQANWAADRSDAWQNGYNRGIRHALEEAARARR